MRYVIDLDGTLCTTVDSDYRNSQPIVDRIKMVNQLYDDGHRIIIYTARGMSSHMGSKWQSEKAFWGLTFLMLGEWGLKYHELIFGKPAGDIYIDDKGVSANDFFSRTNTSQGMGI